MILYGTVISLSDTKTLILKTQFKTFYIRLPRSLYHRYKPLLLKNQRIVAHLKKDKRHWKISRILKVLTPSGDVLNPLFHQNHVLDDTRALINAMEYTMFIDFEMSMHPYYYSPSFVSEIIQVGYVLTDANHQIIESYKTYIKPVKYPTLTDRTLKFLKIKQKDIDEGVPFKAFYKHFKAVMDEYKPAIFTWGSNDESMFKEAIRLNHQTFMDDLRFIDLLKMHKHVYMYKNDLGLQKAYEMYGNHSYQPQVHDALDDAYMTEKIFQGFKAYLNQTKPVLSSYYLYD